MTHVAHLIPYAGREHGGPVASLADMSRSLADLGLRVSVWSAALPGEGALVDFDPRVATTVLPGRRALGFRRCPELWRRFRAQIESVDILHSHSLWTDVNRLAWRAARGRRVPHVLAPCGALAPLALRHRGWKKIPIRLWFQDRALREVSCFHAKSPRELADIRARGLTNPVAVIGNIVHGPPPECRPDAAAFRARFAIPAERRVILYLGRLHPVKGLARLLDAWAFRRADHAAWRLALAGPDEDGHRAKLERRVRELGLDKSVVFTGPLDGRDKWNALAAADYFVMPSDFENFGLAVAEALACGVPAITTTGAPWSELAERGAGWWVEPTAGALAAALAEATTMPDEARRARGERCRALAEPFRAASVAENLAALYGWLRGEGERPPFVHLHE